MAPTPRQRTSARTRPRAGPADTAERSSLGNRPSSTGFVVGMAANPEPYWPLSDLHRVCAMIAAEPSQTRRARSSSSEATGDCATLCVPAPRPQVLTFGRRDPGESGVVPLALL